MNGNRIDVGLLTDDGVSRSKAIHLTLLHLEERKSNFVKFLLKSMMPPKSTDSISTTTVSNGQALDAALLSKVGVGHHENTMPVAKVQHVLQVTPCTEHSGHLHWHAVVVDLSDVDTLPELPWG